MPTSDSWLTVHDGHLCFGDAGIVDVAREAETPFFLYGERRLLRHTIAELRRAFGGRAHAVRSSTPAKRAPTCSS